MTTRSLAVLSILALAVPVLAAPAPAHAGDWADAIGVTASVKGVPQSVDHTDEWSRAIGVEGVKGHSRTARKDPYGFLEQAKAHRGGHTPARQPGQIAVR